MKNAALTLSFVLIIGCGRNDLDMIGHNGYGSENLALNEMAIQPITEQGQNEVGQPQLETQNARKIIKDGYLEVKTHDIKSSREFIDSLLKSHDCYLSSERFEDQNTKWGYYLTIRVSSIQFDDFLISIENGPDKIVEKNINASDVTEQYYDLKTRLDNNKTVERRYLELLNQATSVKDILEIEKSLGEIRGEIETQQGKLNRLDNQVSYSTLNIYLTQLKPINKSNSDRDPFLRKIGISLKQGWIGFVDFIIVMVEIWPLWLGGILIWRLILNRNKRKKK